MKNYINENQIIEIICVQHGSFWMKAKDHIGENEEKIAYGCWKCNDHKKV